MTQVSLEIRMLRGGDGNSLAVTGVTLLADGDALVIGAYYAEATIGVGEPWAITLPHETGEYAGSAFVARFDPEGVPRWVRRSRGAGEIHPGAVTELPGGGLVVTARAEGAAELVGDGAAFALTDREHQLVLLGLSGDGTPQWANSAGGPGALLAPDYSRKPEWSQLVPFGQGLLVRGRLFADGQPGDEAVFGPGEPRETTLSPPADAEGVSYYAASYAADGRLGAAEPAPLLRAGIAVDVLHPTADGLLGVGTVAAEVTVPTVDGGVTLTPEGASDCVVVTLTP